MPSYPYDQISIPAEVKIVHWNSFKILPVDSCECRFLGLALLFAEHGAWLRHIKYHAKQLSKSCNTLCYSQGEAYMSVKAACYIPCRSVMHLRLKHFLFQVTVQRQSDGTLHPYMPSNHCILCLSLPFPFSFLPIFIESQLLCILSQG